MSPQYSVRPFSGANYRKNCARCQGEEYPCAICGKPIKDGSKAVWATIINGGADWGDESSDVNDPGYMGGYPVGPDCHRKYLVKVVE